MKFQLLLVKPFRSMRTLSWLLISLLSNAQAGEIFVSTSVNGIQKWSTHAVDATYTKTSIADEQFIMPTKPLVVRTFGNKSKIDKKHVTDITRVELRRTINQISSKYDVDPELIEALIATESNFNTHAISPKGARGLMQLMPATAKRYGMRSEQDLHIPSKNIDMGVRHLKDLLKLHEGQVALAIASYNAGQGAVNKHGQRIPAYRETMLYVPAVLSYMARFNSDAQSAPNAASIAN